MADYTESAFYKVRKWLISEMYANGILNPAHYTHASPVVPIQQIPEATDNEAISISGLPKDAPFIVYDILIPGRYDTDFWNCNEELMLWIYDYDIDKLLQIKEFLYDLFGREDLSAADINAFDDGKSIFRFHHFSIMMGLPSNEIDQVLGRSGINMVITYEFTRERTASGRFA